MKAVITIFAAQAAVIGFISGPILAYFDKPLWGVPMFAGLLMMSLAALNHTHGENG